MQNFKNSKKKEAQAGSCERGEEWEEEIVGESGVFLFRAALILPIYKTLKIKN